MKSFRHLYPQVWSFENLLVAWRRAARGKRSRPNAVGSGSRVTDQLKHLREKGRDPRAGPWSARARPDAPSAEP